MIAQSIAFVYAAGARRAGRERSAPDDPAMAGTVERLQALEDAVLALPEGIVLRYGFFYGPGTWSEEAARTPALHVDAAAQAAMLALARGTPGIYNIAEDDDRLSSEKAKRDLGFDAAFRL